MQLIDTQVLRTVVGGVGVYDEGGINGGTLNIPPSALAEAMAPAEKVA